MYNRRRFLLSGAALTGAAFVPGIALPLSPAPGLQRRRIAASGEMVPVIGMGTSGSFEVGADAEARAALSEVLRRFTAAGATLIDTAPTYGSAEGVLGELVAELGLRDSLFLATKLSGVSGREAGLAQFEATLKRLKTDKVDLLQVHNLRDWRTQLALARELKQQGRVRYVGLTHFRDEAHEELSDAMAESRPDFLQINYSVTQRAAEKRVFPLAQELGVAVLANRNFNDGSLFSQVKGRPLPAWASEAGVSSWAQLFLKFALSHPAVTVVIPATGKPDRQSDNLKAGMGVTLDQQQRNALIAEFA